MDQLHGKTAVITGAASGIGRALADAFATEGMQLMLADLAADRLDATAAQLRGRGVDVATRVTDVADGAEVEALAKEAMAAFGGVHLVCNNAGVGAGGLIAGFDVDQWKRVIDIDLWSVLHGLRVFLPLLIEQGEGHIVNTASVAGLFSAAFMGPYTVSKFGVVAISETAFHELAMFAPGVGISVLCPGWVRTNIADAHLDPDGAPDEGAEMFADVLRGFIESGMDPAEVAAQVVSGVKERRFYILTHPTSRDMVRQRMEAILAGQDPPPVSPDDL
jgi:NAD(P)-dependent dehydrogenase (short-subunit alcohol dehydrogenase family)